MHLTREQVRDVDRKAIEEFTVPGVVLMENAGRGTAELLMRLGIHAPVAVCCGKGNNGGDGFVIARHLDNHQFPVKVVLFADANELSGDAAVNYQIIEKSGIPIATLSGPKFSIERVTEEIANCEWVVDAVFGTGLKGAVRSPYDQIISALNDSKKQILAVDIPSGLDCDTGKPLGAAIRAHHTATFVAEKIGFMQSSARAWTGQVQVIDIGAPRRCLPG